VSVSANEDAIKIEGNVRTSWGVEEMIEQAVLCDVDIEEIKVEPSLHDSCGHSNGVNAVACQISGGKSVTSFKADQSGY
jgi:hypothetical protein